jgi:hypothetical protein
MSNIDVTPGTGKTVATESAGGAEFQKIQLWGAGGSSIVSISPDGSIKVSVIGTINAVQSGTVTTSISGTVTTTVTGTVLTAMNGSVLTQLAPTASYVSGVTSLITATTPTSVLVAAGGAIKNYVTHIIATNAALVGTFVDIKDGGGNVMYSGYAAASGGGFVANINPPLVGSANKSVDAVARTQASIIVAMTGFTA